MISRHTAAPRYSALDLGPLPVSRINAVLGTELEPGNARVSRRAHQHMAEDHPDDYALCRPALLAAVASPTLIGQDPKHARNFVLVKRIGLPDGRAVLVAIGLEAEGGAYNVRTSYLISEQTVSDRRAAGRLRIPPPE